MTYPEPTTLLTNVDRLKSHLAEHVAKVHQGHHRESAVRCGLGDAAALCDALSVEIERQHTRGGRITKQGQALAAVARACGDLVWGQRDMVGPKPVRGAEAVLRAGETLDAEAFPVVVA